MYEDLLISLQLRILINTQERNAVLHQLHRALITSPTPLPNTILTLSILDTPHTHALSFARSNDPQIPSLYWLMPHFSFWAWPLPFIGTLDSALSRISAIEASHPWEKKIDKVVWRGTAWFNSVGNTNLRPKLLEVTKGQPWADVEDLVWYDGGEKARNALQIEEFCKYKYIIYTEVPWLPIPFPYLPLPQTQSQREEN